MNFKTWLRVTSAGVQMWLTIFVTSVFNAILGYGVLRGELSWKDYIATVAPVNTMIVSFWLGSETAVRTAPPAPPSEELK